MAQPVRLRRAVAADAPRLAAAAPATDPETEKVVADIIADVKARGKTAILEHATRLGDIKQGDPLFLEPPALEAAFKSLPVAQQLLLERVAINIKTFAVCHKFASSIHSTHSSSIFNPFYLFLDRSTKVDS
jgi:histidinol dehydrogenase